MKKILEFSDKEPEDRVKFHHANKGEDYYYAIIEFSNYLHTLIKHSDKTEVSIEELNDRFYSVMNNRGVDFI